MPGLFGKLHERADRIAAWASLGQLAWQVLAVVMSTLGASAFLGWLARYVHAVNEQGPTAWVFDGIAAAFVLAFTACPITGPIVALWWFFTKPGREARSKGYPAKPDPEPVAAPEPAVVPGRRRLDPTFAPWAKADDREKDIINLSWMLIGELEHAVMVDALSEAPT